MPTLRFNNQTFTLNTNDSVLDTLLAAGIDAPFGCRAGSCHACMMKVTEGKVPTDAQLTLNELQKSLGYFLPCSCYPEEDLTIGETDDATFDEIVSVASSDMMNDNVLRVRLEKSFDYRPGQFIKLWKDAKTARSYSLASHPTLDDYLECHIKVISDGEFSAWAKDQLTSGSKIRVQGPYGQCIYDINAKQRPLLLAGIGTGLAPLIGILKDALYHQHAGPISLIIGSRSTANIYLYNELTALTNEHSNLNIQFVCQTTPETSSDKQPDMTQSNILTGDIYKTLKQQHPATSEHVIYLCGAESFVQKARKQCFLSGASMQDIHADAFTPS